jgi:hypothetical protein
MMHPLPSNLRIVLVQKLPIRVTACVPKGQEGFLSWQGSAEPIRIGYKSGYTRLSKLYLIWYRVWGTFYIGCIGRPRHPAYWHVVHRV